MSAAVSAAVSLNPESDLIDLINGSVAASGGTPEGLSRDKKARDCGMSSAFYGAVARRPTLYPEMVYDLKGKPRVIGTRAGTAYHAMRELTAGGQALPTTDAARFKLIDPAIEAALMAFNRTDTRVFGTTLGVEMPVAGQLGGHSRTGRLDRVVEADVDTVERWMDYGLFSAAPGLYLWDYKLYKAVTTTLAEQHSRDMQALAYMRLYEQQTGRRPDGFIYDLTSRAKDPTIVRLLVLVPNSNDANNIIDFYVREAEKARLAGVADAGKCDNQYGACPFIKHCPRYGTAEQHKDIIENYKQLNTVVEEEDE